MDRTLYLNEKKGLAVIRDGPSLWIREKDKAGIRVPARLINMVFIIGNIRMDAGTIALFAENNTPVTLMNRRGDAIAVVMPYNHQSPDHHEEQRRFLRQEGHLDTFREWTSSMRRETQLLVMKKIDWETAQTFLAKGFREKDYTNIVDARRLSKAEEWKTVHEIARNFLMEMVVREIVASDLDPHMGILNREHNFGFALDLYHIIEPEADLLAVQFFTSCRWHDFTVRTNNGSTLSKEGWKNIVQRFENRKKVLAQRMDGIIRGYFDLLRYTAVS